MVVSPYQTEAWPLDVTYESDKKILHIRFDDGLNTSLSAELLRVESPSAEVQGHGGDTKKTISGRRHVGIIKLEPVGNYALRIHFDDLHDSGIYSWQYLHKLARAQDRIWQDYLETLARKGLQRDP